MSIEQIITDLESGNLSGPTAIVKRLRAVTAKPETPTDTGEAMLREILAQEIIIRTTGAKNYAGYVRHALGSPVIDAGWTCSINAALSALRRVSQTGRGEARVRALEDVYAKAVRWRESRTEYLIACEIALSTHAPIEGGTRYRSHAAASAMAASDLTDALQKVAALAVQEGQ